jgi:hypothetical protein
VKKVKKVSEDYRSCHSAMLRSCRLHKSEN